MAAEENVEWAHHAEDQLPSFADAVTCRVVPHHLPFWKMVNTHVHSIGPFPSLNLCKHGAHSLPSRMNGGLDGATHFREILRTPTGALIWEQKLVVQTLKIVFVNAFIAWRMLERVYVLKSAPTFQTLNRYRHILNKVQSFGEFLLNVSIGLLDHTSRVSDNDDQISDMDVAAQTSTEE